MLLYAGIDVGSSATKAVLIDDEQNPVGRGLSISGADFAAAARKAFDHALAEAGSGADEVQATVATGYGRTNVDFSQARRTEIDCHGRGAYHHFPEAITVLDIGGQDNKVIQLNRDGSRKTFTMNRKCAAGTGSFLEEMAHRLNIPLADFARLAEKAKDPSVKIGSYCTVFAMTEILSRIRAGTKPEDLARAALVSVARRVLETAAFTSPVVVTGGVVAHVPLLADILADILAAEVKVPPHPQHVGALGAALVAKNLVVL
jgi:predicted CoA-substrate-specific enzyme activase